jgi:hypothetical protein
MVLQVIRLKIAPRLTLNVSKRGVSLSLGKRGAHATIGWQDIRKNRNQPQD